MTRTPSVLCSIGDHSPLLQRSDGLIRTSGDDVLQSDPTIWELVCFPTANFQACVFET